MLKSFRQQDHPSLIGAPAGRALRHSKDGREKVGNENDWPRTRLGRSAGQYPALLIIGWLAFGSLAQAGDSDGLRRGGDPSQVSISGLSSGAAMALQYAVAHSSSIIGVGSIAGPSWACAEGDLVRAMQVCLNAQGNPLPKTDFARQLASEGKIDSLPGDTTLAL